MKTKRYIISSVIILLLFSLASAADTTMVYANQLNHYYQFGGWNRFSAEFGKIHVYNGISNSSSIYSETQDGKTLAVLGDWIHHRSYGLIDETGFKLIEIK
ncbi:MAG: hypothetical protein J7L40_00790 [Candidatus Marinimicrobia bacterium]|nr:hypothetical protein [Candidatus Neomarinimicrobiota bacterium]